MPKLTSAFLALGLLSPCALAVVPQRAERPYAFAGTVQGTVFDSVGGRPLGNALVQLVATDDRSRTRSSLSGADGSFRFDSVPNGEWLAGFYHPTLDEYGVAVTTTRVRIVDAADVHISLAVPSARTLIDGVCGASDATDRGMYVGFVRDPEGSTIPHARVQLSWNAISVGSEGIAQHTFTRDVEASDQGGFSVCDIPAGGVVVAHAWSATDSSGFVELDVPTAGFFRRDLMIARNHTVPAPPGDGTAGYVPLGDRARVTRGEGTLRGRVTERGGRPVRNARVVLWGSGIEANTAADGSFTMTQLPLGSWTLEGRALGFVRSRQPVDISAGRGAEANISLDAVSTVLDTVRVLGQRIVPSADMRDFERRRKSGFGSFLDETDIERRHPLFASDLFRMIPGVTVLPTGMFGHAILMRARTLGISSRDSISGGSEFCVPAYFIDGVRVFSDDGDVEMFVSTAEIRAIEIYSRASNVPAQFNATNGCGSIVIHTGPRAVVRPVR